MRLLIDGPSDPVWLEALESLAAETGAKVSIARAETVRALRSEIDERGERPFPAAFLDLSGEFDQLALQGAAVGDIEAQLGHALGNSRARDTAAGRALTGPHRGDLQVVHRQKDRPAAECSTGEQKALILSLVLAQAARLSRAKSQPTPVLLLDEVAAHLDGIRRGALFAEIEALSLQAFLTGTDEILFETLKGRALGVRVDASILTVLDD
jgi:DNA replication and repair protein RecF